VLKKTLRVLAVFQQEKLGIFGAQKLGKQVAIE